MRYSNLKNPFKNNNCIGLLQIGAHFPLSFVNQWRGYYVGYDAWKMVGRFVTWLSCFLVIRSADGGDPCGYMFSICRRESSMETVSAVVKSLEAVWSTIRPLQVIGLMWVARNTTLLVVYLHVFSSFVHPSIHPSFLPSFLRSSYRHRSACQTNFIQVDGKRWEKKDGKRKL